MPIVPGHRRWRQENQEFEIILCSTASFRANETLTKKQNKGFPWWHTSLIPAFCEFKASLVYIISFSPVKET